MVSMMLQSAWEFGNVLSPYHLRNNIPLRVMLQSSIEDAAHEAMTTDTEDLAEGAKSLSICDNISAQESHQDRLAMGLRAPTSGA